MKQVTKAAPVIMENEDRYKISREPNYANRSFYQSLLPGATSKSVKEEFFPDLQGVEAAVLGDKFIIYYPLNHEAAVLTRIINIVQAARKRELAEATQAKAEMPKRKSVRVKEQAPSTKPDGAGGKKKESQET